MEPGGTMSAAIGICIEEIITIITFMVATDGPGEDSGVLVSTFTD
jgi:type III secretory pathway component EscV